MHRAALVDKGSQSDFAAGFMNDGSYCANDGAFSKISKDQWLAVSAFDRFRDA
ncbi:hypothetical protein [Ruegeria sp. EL01]|uniref:hypothetical protein n=1 Tax=Ruegeria sp. EL01 TaxID=2107578 RepID=UPI0013C4F75A|nr:hypothetical protein [Ruegeria sp. EL01]